MGARTPCTGRSRPWTRLAALAAAALLLSGAGVALATDAHPDPQPEGGPVQLLFIHHSCGGQLLAEPGPDQGASCIYVSHPNGGGLRARLEAAGFAVNEASYGSIIGADTDICHWRRKFSDHLDRILRTRHQDELLADGLTNRIVAFKSCFPNNQFVGPGSEPGDPDACELTVANAKAAYRGLLETFAGRPDVLFVAFTAPPLAEAQGLKGVVKRLIKGKARHPQWAREFNGWLADRDHGWLAGYDRPNVVVFDYYDILTDEGVSNWSAYPAGPGDDHPSSDGNSKAADAFLPFLQKALRDFGPPSP